MPALDTKLITFALGLLLGIGTAYDQPAFLALAAVVFVMSLMTSKRNTDGANTRADKGASNTK